MATQLQQRVLDEIKRLEKVATELGYKVPRVKKVQFKQVGQSAGWCKALSRTMGTPDCEVTLQIHGGLLEEHGDDFIKEVVGHEYAHAVCFRNYSHNVNHGIEWKQVMVEFGLRPERTHKYEVKQYKKKRSNILLLTCAKKTFTMTKKRALRSLKVTCPCCKSEVAIVGRETEVNDRHVDQVRADLDFKQGVWNTTKHHFITHGQYQPGAKQHQRENEMSQVASAPSKPAAKTTGVPTKKQLAVRIVRNMYAQGHRESKVFIQVLETELGMSTAGARTYYYNARTALGIS